MADKFHVGQRVIWTIPKNGREFTATVRSQRQMLRFKETKRRYFVYRMDVDGYGQRDPYGYLFAAPQRELRPIYDGDQASSWSECSWQPNGVRAEA